MGSGIILTYKRIIKIIMTLFFFITISFCLYCIHTYPLEREFLLTIPIIFACVLGWIFLVYYKIEITDKSIKKYGVKRIVTIDYNDVTKLELYTTHLIVKSKWRRINLSADLVNQKEAIKVILEKLKHRKNTIKVTGEVTFVKDFLSK